MLTRREHGLPGLPPPSASAATPRPPRKRLCMVAQPRGWSLRKSPPPEGCVTLAGGSSSTKPFCAAPPAAAAKLSWTAAQPESAAEGSVTGAGGSSSWPDPLGARSAGALALEGSATGPPGETDPIEATVSADSCVVMVLEDVLRPSSSAVQMSLTGKSPGPAPASAALSASARTASVTLSSDRSGGGCTQTSSWVQRFPSNVLHPVVWGPGSTHSWWPLGGDQGNVTGLWPRPSQSRVSHAVAGCLLFAH